MEPYVPLQVPMVVESERRNAAVPEDDGEPPPPEDPPPGGPPVLTHEGQVIALPIRTKGSENVRTCSLPFKAAVSPFMSVVDRVTSPVRPATEDTAPPAPPPVAVNVPFTRLKPGPSGTACFLASRSLTTTPGTGGVACPESGSLIRSDSSTTSKSEPCRIECSETSSSGSQRG